VRIESLEDRAGPLKSVGLVLVPRARWCGLELDLCLDDVELLFELFELFVVDLKTEGR
jgi:hypothetical protein